MSSPAARDVLSTDKSSGIQASALCISGLGAHTSGPSGRSVVYREERPFRTDLPGFGTWLGHLRLGYLLQITSLSLSLLIGKVGLIMST